MICIARERKTIYKKLLVDIWGYYATRVKGSNKKEKDRELEKKRLRLKRKREMVVRFFGKVRRIRRDRWRFRNRRIVYQLKTVNTFNLPKRLKNKIAKLRIFRYFYMFFSKHTLYKWFKYSIKGVNYFIEDFLRLLEGNLMMLSYRLNFYSNLFVIPFMLKKGHFMVNFKSVRDYRESLKIGDWFGVSKEFISMYQASMFIRLDRGVIYQRGLKNFFINYFTLLCVFFKIFEKNSLINPVKLDILRIHDIFRDIR